MLHFYSTKSNASLVIFDRNIWIVEHQSFVKLNSIKSVYLLGSSPFSDGGIIFDSGDTYVQCEFGNGEIWGEIIFNIAGDESTVRGFNIQNI
ncbi:MAG: hypothetical protein ABDH59_05990, partial [Fervidobacterium sp.]